MTDQWRQFQLFNLTPISDPNLHTEDALYSDSTLSAVAGTNSYLIIAVQNCLVKVISKELKLLKSFFAYNPEYKIHYMSSVTQSDLLVTLAERQGYPAVLKLWDIRKLIEFNDDKEVKSIHTDEDQYQYLTEVKINNGENNFPITSVDFNFDLSCVAVGYANGKVILIRGDLLRDRGSKQRLIYESSDPVTGVHFNQKDTTLFVTTTSKILTFSTTGRNNGRPSRILSKKSGADVNCSSIDPLSQQLMVADSDSIKYYSPFTNTQSIVLNMEKKFIYPFDENYLMILTPQTSLSLSSNSSTQSKVLIFDMKNKHISLSVNFPNATISNVISIWGDVYILSTDGIFYKIHEKSINQQIEILSQRHLYDIAYKLAQQANLSNSTLFDIRKNHGEHLCELQEWDKAIDVFSQSLELVDSNESNEKLADFIMDIITKFKDVSNITNLTKFLFKLYTLNLADNDHLTLLLCCYCKLKKLQELDQFIDELNLDDNNSSKVQIADLNFPLIINLFKECGYYHQVIKLLKKLHQPRDIVDIQLNYLHEAKACLEYICSLTVDEVLLVLIDYSKDLLDVLPLETTKLLINVFTGKYSPRDDLKIESKPVEDSSFPINSYKNFVAYFSGSESGEKTENETPISSEPTYLPPRASLVFRSFINNPNEFVVFLEACIDTFDKFQGSDADKSELIMTLFEMYLDLGQKEANDIWKQKALELIDNYSTLLNKSSLLLISQVYGFTGGEIIAKEVGGFEESLFRLQAILGNVEGCFKLALKYGDTNPGLYKLLLKFTVSKKEIFDQVSENDLQSVIEQVKSSKLASPLEIIQILSSTEFAKIGLIKKFLIDHIQTQDKEIFNNQKLIQSYEQESTKYGQQLTDLAEKPFIISNNKCSACKLKLDFPVSHFKCAHSYHQRCLNESSVVSTSALKSNNQNNSECPLCANELEDIRSMKAKQFQAKEELAFFEQSLHEKDDRFKVICDFFGKGIMEEDSTVVLESYK